MFVIRHRKIWFAFSALLIAVSAYGAFIYGFNQSIDFKGGTITEVRFERERPAKASVEESIGTLNLGGFSVRPLREDSYIIRTRELSQGEAEELYRTLSLSDPVFEIVRSNTIGPVAGAELKNKAMWAMLVVIMMIVLFVTFAFRHVSKKLSSWKYGLVTIISMLHDIAIPTGAFIILGHFIGLEIDLLFVSGLLAVLGYSVHDTIVVFDRVRENLRVNEELKVEEPFEGTVGRAISQTIGRSINTSVTTLIMLLALYFIGSTATKDFALLLIVGIIAGTYSSIFVASPLLVTFYKWQRK